MTNAEIQNIALDKLIPSPANVRKTGTDEGIEELAASIASHGLLQNLGARKGEKGKFEVVAGGRRLAALRLLAKRKQIAKDFPVPVKLIEAEGETEVSLAENVVRVRMTDADMIEAFGRLNAEQGLSTDEIAGRFGISPLVVSRRIKLAGLSPRIFAAFRSGEATLQQLQALAITDDHARQEAAFFDVSQWEREPYRIKQRLSEGVAKADSSMARFVGLDVYKAAGGTMQTDLFADGNSGLLTDLALLTRLANEKLEAAAEEERAQGWAWVTVDPKLDGVHSYGRVYAKQTPLSDQQQAELAALQERYEALEGEIEGREDDDSDEFQALSDEIDRIGIAIDAIQPQREFLPGDIARAGAMIGIGYNGELRVERGLIERETGTSKAKAKKGRADGDAQGGNEVVLAGALVEELTAIRTAALRVEVSRNPKVALAAMVYRLALRQFYDMPSYKLPGSALEIDGEWCDLSKSVKEAEEDPTLKAWQDVLAEAGAQVPTNAGDLWNWVIEQDETTLMKLMAVLVSANLNAKQFAFENKRSSRVEHADRLAEAVGLDMNVWWCPKRRFLGRLSKAGIAGVMREAGLSEDAAKAIMSKPKSEAVDRAEDDLAGNTWLPAPLRTYPAPARSESTDDGADFEEGGDEDADDAFDEAAE
ncbi:ParB/RepB/Spo0J family partition protein [Labrys sp. 22185]|uniref:ParB/RepB/Spo0J family partition protein n=1 Tax=Labrys sp. 22185 TaxID=3453888 RepID=UPI003F8549F4